MKPFNLTRSAGNSADLAFICEGCGAKHTHDSAKQGCCAGKMFRVAKIVFHDPYRTTSDPDDGYKINNPGTQGEIGESGLGSTRFRNEAPGYDEQSQQNYLPQDGSPYDDFGTGENSSSDAFMSEPSMVGSEGAAAGLDPAHKQVPTAIGPHNMQSRLMWNKGDLFDRIRKQRKEQ